MAEKSFAVMPSVSIARSKFDRISSHKTAIKLGDIVPLYVDEVLPGDTRSIDYGSLIRMATPIAPIMDDIYFELFAFFVPNRLTWDHWKEFCGESDRAGYSTTEYIIPTTTVYGSIVDSPYSIGNYMGISCAHGDVDSFEVSELPLRAYGLIINRWFRNQNVEAPLYIDTGDDVENSDLSYSGYCLKASKKADYFTKALPYAQKGTPVMLPLGNTAPIIAAQNTHGTINPIKFGVSGTNGSLHLKTGNLSYDVNDVTSTGLVTAQNTNLVADLSNATASTINQLREAYALQLALEKDANYGTRYWEVLFGHFGVVSPDATLQDPEFLGHAKININIEQVLQTTGYQADSSSALGSIGANSVSGDKGSLFTKSFVEHGYIMILGVARHRESYGQGINKMFTRKRRFDFYWPVFAHLGAQPVYNKELYVQGTPADNEIFGYQEAWAEYRYKPNLATSIMNPASSNSLDFWTLTSKFDELPTLSTSFTKANRNSLSRALTTGSEGPDFICDFVFKDTAVRPMPLYSIPGLLGEM